MLELRDEGREATLPGPAPATAEAPLASVVAMAGLGAAAVAQGAYHLRGQVLAGLLLGAALLVGLAGRRLAASDLRFPPLAVCAALAGWAVVSATVAGVPAAALPPMALLAGVMLVVVLCRQGGDSVATGLIAIGVLVAVSGLAGVAWRHEPWTLEDQGLWRAATTLTYANAAAGLLVPLALLAAGRLIARPGSRSGATATCVLLAGAGATLSRGGFLALLLGGVLLARAAGARRLFAATAGPAAGALVVLAALAPSMVVGRPPRPILAVAGMAAGLAVAVILAARPRAAAAVLLVASALVAGAAGLTGVLDPASASRMTLASPDRTNEAKAAFRVAADHPLTGAGPGQVVLRWHDGDGQRLVARYAHNEYLQTWAELGVIGLALVLALGLAVIRHIRGAGPLDPVAAAAAAGLGAVALHSSLDFLWHIPVIPLVCAALVAVACQPRQGAPR